MFLVVTLGARGLQPKTCIRTTIITTRIGNLAKRTRGKGEVERKVRRRGMPLDKKPLDKIKAPVNKNTLSLRAILVHHLIEHNRYSYNHGIESIITYV